MAIWQFSISLIPQTWFEAGRDIQSLFSESGFDPSPAWQNHNNPTLLSRLAAILPPAKSRHDALLLWGVSERDELRIWRQGESITDVSLLFDLRQPDIALFRTITGVATEFALVVIDRSGRRIVGHDTNTLLRAAAESDAAHFVLDPLSFLSQVDPGEMAT